MKFLALAVAAIATVHAEEGGDEDWDDYDKDGEDSDEDWAEKIPDEAYGECYTSSDCASATTGPYCVFTYQETEDDEGSWPTPSFCGTEADCQAAKDDSKEDMEEM